MKIDNIIVAKLSCDDNILKASKKFGANEIKEVVAAALTFTPFEVENVEMLNARVSEKYFSACKKLGYATGFFREHTILALCQLQSASSFGFDGIYVPFSGEIYLIPRGCMDAEAASAGKSELVLSQANNVKKVRQFSIRVEDADERLAVWKKIQVKLTGGRSFSEFNGKRISALIAEQDVRIEVIQGKESAAEYPAMHFLYNEE